jgi:MFS family permease
MNVKTTVMKDLAKKGNNAFSGWKIAGILLVMYMFTMGFIFYAYSVIFPAMVETLGWNRGTASFAQTLNIILMGGVFPPLMALSMNKFGAKKTMMAGILIQIAGLLLLGVLTSRMWQFILFWGVLVSFGFCFAGALPVQNTLFFWFSKKRAMALGMVMTGGAVGGFIAQPLFTWILQLTGHWKTCWLVAAVIAVISFIMVFFIKNKPQDLGQFPDGIDPGADKGSTNVGGVLKAKGPFRTNEKWELKETFKMPQLYLLILIAVAFSMPLFFITSHGILHFMDGGFTKMQAASVLSAILLASGITRFPAGILADRVEPRWVAVLSMVAMTAAVFGIWKFNHFNMLIIAGIIFGVCFGTMAIIQPILLGNYFGPELFSSIMGAAAPFSILFLSSVPVVSGFIYEASGSYDYAFIGILFILFLSGVAGLFLTPPKRKQAKY